MSDTSTVHALRVENERLREEVARLGMRSEAVTDWQPIETAPKNDGQEILGWDAGNGVQLCNWMGYPNGDGAWWVLLEFTTEPTHWMPLPAPPAALGSTP